jgi:hypothetical protein
MRNQVLQNYLSAGAKVRLLLVAAMGLVLAFMVLLSSQQAAAQSVLQEPYGLSRDEIVSQLGSSYKEVPVAGGIAANGHILEVFVSPDGLSWTIVVTRPDGMSNVIAVGEDWSSFTALKGMPI